MSADLNHKYLQYRSSCSRAIKCSALLSSCIVLCPYCLERSDFFFCGSAGQHPDKAFLSSIYPWFRWFFFNPSCFICKLLELGLSFLRFSFYNSYANLGNEIIKATITRSCTRDSLSAHNCKGCLPLFIDAGLTILQFEMLILYCNNVRNLLLEVWIYIIIY